jgi:hypothetical protein
MDTFARATYGLVSTVSFALYSSSAAGQNAIVHPSKASLTGTATERVVGLRDTSSTDVNLDRQARRLRAATRIDSIGELDGDESTVLGLINDIAVDERGRVFVLDMGFSNLRVFSADGTPEFTIGQKGSGPLDLRFGVSIWTTGNGAVAVTDAVLGTKYIAAENKAATRLLRVVPTTGNPSGACESKGQLITFSPGAKATDKLIRKLDAAGRELSSYGEVYTASSSLARMIMSEGTVGCMTDGSTVSTQSKLPFIVSHTADGAERWRLRLRDFAPGRELEEVDEKSRHSIGLDPKSVTSSYTYRITPFGGYAIIQVGNRTARSMRNRVLWERLDTYLADINTGKAVFVSARLPMLDEIRGSSVHGYDNDPYPRVIRLRINP